MWVENKKADSRFIYIFKIFLVKGDGDEFSEGETRETKDGLEERCGDIHIQKRAEQQELEKEPGKEKSGLSENWESSGSTVKGGSYFKTLCFTW